MDREAWQAIVPGVAKTGTQLRDQLSLFTQNISLNKQGNNIQP